MPTGPLILPVATSAVATRLSIADRGLIKEGMKADIVVFDPATIGDKATFEKPHQLSDEIEARYTQAFDALTATVMVPPSVTTPSALST